ncbi:uncharacterized protein LOC114528594 [Dendronephthya gigantea]|uniref:uncharacterized protein LOC114528594 n=1 Tax=Dendronephthya gigantea TaxID=151771 RepID=UPI001069D484|nr:uncharacterized protein LOC114528594 [Dendronephthya gigantea]
MVSWIKALGIVLLLYSTEFNSEGRKLGKDSSSDKKTTQLTTEETSRLLYKDEAKINAEELRQLIVNVSYDPRLQNVTGAGHFAYMYIQPAHEEPKLYIESQVVSNKLRGNFSSAPYFNNGRIYPALPPPGHTDNSNFRMAFRDPKRNESNNLSQDHTEYKILSGRGLENMLQSFLVLTKLCPKYIILYSTNLPRLKGHHGKHHGLEMIGKARRNIPKIVSKHRQCDDIKSEFYLYTGQMSPTELNEADNIPKHQKLLSDKEKRYLKKHSIEWITL